MVLSDEERRERNRQAAARYRKKLKEKAAAGDEKATKQLNKTHLKKEFASVTSYIRTKATRKEISIIRDLSAERIKKLKQESN